MSHLHKNEEMQMENTLSLLRFGSTNESIGSSHATSHGRGIATEDVHAWFVT